MYERNEVLRAELDKLGYEGVSIWNTLIDLRDRTLGKDVLETVARLDNELAEFQNKHGNMGVYTREFSKFCDMKRNLGIYKEKHYDNELIRPLTVALNDLYYSNSVTVQNDCMKTCINFIKAHSDILAERKK